MMMAMCCGGGLWARGEDKVVGSNNWFLILEASTQSQRLVRCFFGMGKGWSACPARGLGLGFDLVVFELYHRGSAQNF